jgi:hypothetical protein
MKAMLLSSLLTILSATAFADNDYATQYKADMLVALTDTENTPVPLDVQNQITQIINGQDAEKSVIFISSFECKDVSGFAGGANKECTLLIIDRDSNSQPVLESSLTIVFRAKVDGSAVSVTEIVDVTSAG